MLINQLEEGQIFVDCCSATPIVITRIIPSRHQIAGYNLRSNNEISLLKVEVGTKTYIDFHTDEWEKGRTEIIEMFFEPSEIISVDSLQIGDFFIQPYFNLPCMRVEEEDSYFESSRFQAVLLANTRYLGIGSYCYVYPRDNRNAQIQKLIPHFSYDEE